MSLHRDHCAWCDGMVRNGERYCSIECDRRSDTHDRAHRFQYDEAAMAELARWLDFEAAQQINRANKEPAHRGQIIRRAAHAKRAAISITALLELRQQTAERTLEAAA